MITGGLVLVVAIAVAVGVLFARRGNPDWIQAISRSAGQSVVKLRTAQGEGTGFVVAAKGNDRLILTNRHVLTLEHGFFFTTKTTVPRCRVILSTQEAFDGYLVGFPSDPNTDLALVAVECPAIHPLKVGRFDDIVVGEPVAAVGHPLDFDFTVTNGIVSGKRKSYVQHTAAINPGNSGGPLYDQQSQVIGVNTLVIKDSQGLFLSLRADLILHPGLWTIDPAVRDMMNLVNH